MCRGIDDDKHVYHGVSSKHVVLFCCVVLLSNDELQQQVANEMFSSLSSRSVVYRRSQAERPLLHGVGFLVNIVLSCSCGKMLRQTELFHVIDSAAQSEVRNTTAL